MRPCKIVLVFSVVLAVQLAGADLWAARTVKIATLAPNGSAWMRIFNAWAQDVRQRSHGQLRLRFYPGGVAGDERDVIRKMRTGQMHGGAVTSIGLSQVYRPVLVLQLPGLFRNNRQLDRARNALRGEFEREFERNGYVLMGWGDVGFVHLFSKRPIGTPEDLRRARPWVWSDDPIARELYRVVGATGVPLGLPEVYTGLQTGMIDTIVASPVAMLALQWHSKVRYMTQEAAAVAIGATVISKRFFDRLPEDQQAILRETGAERHRELVEAIRRDDRRAVRTLQNRGLQVVEVPREARHEWEQAFRQTRRRLAPRIYPRELLRRVERLAAGN